MSRITSLAAAALAAVSVLGVASSADARFGNQPLVRVTNTQPLFGNQVNRNVKVNTQPLFGNQVNRNMVVMNQPLFGNQVNRNANPPAHPLFGNQVRP